MSYPQAIVTWPGVVGFIDATVELAHGVTPSMSTLTIPPQAAPIRDFGELRVTMGSTTVRLPDCKIDSGSFQYDRQGAALTFNIYDRRWRWQFGYISGLYNRRDLDGAIDTGAGDALDDTEKSPRQLAALLLDAMGETGYKVDELPNDTRPLVEWDGANPAQELDKLCASLGCHVTLTLRTSKVVIRRVGKGAQLPGGPIAAQTAEVNPPEKPDALVVRCGATVYQVDLLLEAVAEERDGRIVELEKVSYKPDAGWTGAELQDFTDITDEDKRKLAQQSVYRYYRPVVPFELPGFGKVDRLDQIVAILGEQVEKAIISGRTRAKPAIVYGKFATYEDEQRNSTDTVAPYSGTELDPQKLNVAFDIDKERYLFRFAEQVYAVDDDGGIIAPTLRARCSVTVRDRKTRGIKVYEKRRVTPGPRYKTPDKALPHDEIKLTYYPRYNNAFGIVATTDNKASVDKECDHYLDEAVAELTTQPGESATYAGIVPMELDGAIQVVTFRIGDTGAITIIHRNHDPGSPINLPFKVKQQIVTDRRMRELRAAFDIGPHALRETIRRLGNAP